MGRYSDITSSIADSINELGAQLDADFETDNVAPPEPDVADCASGVYTGSTDGSGNAERQFGDWRNREVGVVLSFTPDDKWDTAWWCGQFGGDYPWRDRLCITRGLCLKGQSVENDPGDVFAQWARAVHEAGITDPIFRLGHEANGDWYPWKIEGHETTWAQRFDDAARQIHDNSPDARVQFCLAAGQPVEGFDFPDTSSVDLYAVDLYDLYDQTNDWETHVAIASDYGVPLCLPEWGLWSADDPGGHGDNPSFIDWVADRVGDMRGGFEAYFDKDSSSAHRLELYPNSEQRYLQRFGG